MLSPPLCVSVAANTFVTGNRSRTRAATLEYQENFILLFLFFPDCVGNRLGAASPLPINANTGILGQLPLAAGCNSLQTAYNAQPGVNEKRLERFIARLLHGTLRVRAAKPWARNIPVNPLILFASP